MNRYQWTAVAVCMLLNMLDGFDVMVMAFTANSVSSEWGLTGSELGILLSAGLLGMTIGALLIAPWADRIGRRPLIFVCVAMAGTTMLLSALAQNEWQLGLLRFVTGLGIGGLLSSTNVLASEYSSARWRGLAVSLQSTGFALGATVGGICAALMIDVWGWRSVFMIGGALSLLTLPLVAWKLPESMDFVLSKGGLTSAFRANTIAKRMGREPIATDDVPLPSNKLEPRRFTDMLRKAYRRRTLTLWLLFVIVLFCYYFITTWTPKLLISAGMSESEGITGGIVLNVGGIAGTLAFGFLSTRIELRRLLAVTTAATAVLVALFVTTTTSLTSALTVGLLIGVTINGCIAGLYSSAPRTYPVTVRATGVGTAIGVGRAGAIVSPVIVGALIDGGWTSTHLYLAVAVLMICSTALALALRFDRTPSQHAETRNVATDTTA